ncbi:alpha/beta fold hydrolase [Streptomyces sp. ADMS]|uniref:alpha/beta fold hydrolase n=1 Tax=Streptomyces sp. ADMS TaxID=3071415 RepID=UPI00296EE55D|nr:alpha/beta fold hydrolase [Streptomyces sp. ADMS]MDW4907121.1 alpha/beta fold hydrolase [Streptomyces sp. ADMS]
MSELPPFTFGFDGERLSGVYGGDPGGVTVVLLHGAGAGSKERLVPLLAEFVARGCHGLAFDFSGHGESTGALSELSLRRRFEQAVGVIDARVPADSPLVLVGFSMSGQTVADLAGHYGGRVAALGLCAPAVYGAEAWGVPFGDGDGRFSELIRTPDSWRGAPALEVLRAYEGRAVLTVPGSDHIIPAEVTDAVTEALAARAQFTRLELGDADHFLGLWFREHADDRRGFVDAVLTGLDDRGWTATRCWVAKHLPDGRSVRDALTLYGGWSSQMRRLSLDDDSGLVLRSFVKPFFRHHAPDLLAREADVLTMLADRDGIPVPRLIAVDTTAEHCDHPSLLMSLMPGQVRVDDAEDLERRLDLLAAQLVRIHRVVPKEPEQRPRPYQAWTSPERVRTPGGELWERAVDVIRREAPAYDGCFLHRDFHPGNVLFEGAGDNLRISGVVDWVETSWGPADLDVAHCSTALALLHGAEYGLGFRERYEAQGGRRPADGRDHLYWRLLDALAYAPDAGKLAGPWRELGRVDLTARTLEGRLEGYVGGLLERYA